MTAATVANALAPSGEDWLKLMTASKVAAVLNLSPWESPFSLWHRMNGTVGPKPQTAQTERGHYLEPVVAKWWADQHPEFDVLASPGLHYAADNPRHACSPDATVLTADTSDRIAALEVKTAARDDVWGEQGTDEIPVYYRVQCLWQAYVLDVPRVHLAVLTSYLEFREYVVDRDEADLALIHEKVAAFLASLDAGTPPDLDGHSETYRVVRELHPDIDPVDLTLDPELAEQWLIARDLLAEATDSEQLWRSRLLEHMGRAKRGMHEDRPICQRIPAKNGSPYLKALTFKEKS